ncbi:Hypothetical predicted protein [Paramuricea clavata]|uniref:Uncharacterized protein n=1 Tax=Paramuricea clavata TaxID=317549 RepID=A0A6S7ILU6_PARCT|nr:Hypothetical predicted protein [Paramuricea clavata]
MSHVPHLIKTARNCLIVDHERKRNEQIKPYESADDERLLVWMKDTFMKYFDDWKTSIKTTKGNFTLKEKRCFCLIRHMKALRYQLTPMLKAINFLISEGFSIKYVLLEHFMQDVIEDYFGHQGTQRGRSDNPSAEQFGYNKLTIAVKRDIVTSVSGNTGGQYGKAK